MKKALFVAAAVIAAPALFSPAIAQDGNSRPQPVVHRHGHLFAALEGDDQARAVGAEAQGAGGAHRSIALLCSC